MHAILGDGHAAVLALKGLLPGRPADLSGPASLILLLQVSSIQATSFTFILYSASSTATPIPSRFCTFPLDYDSKMSNGETDKELGKNEG